MGKIKNTKWMPALMVLTILGIAAFQVYWLRKAYEREERNLEMRTNFLFRETVFTLQSGKLKLDRLGPDSGIRRRVFSDTLRRREPNGEATVVDMVNVLMRKARDTGRRMMVQGRGDTMRMVTTNYSGRRNRLVQFLFDIDSAQDSVRIQEVQAAYARRLVEQNLEVPFSVQRVPTVDRERPVFSEVTLGFSQPVTYKLELGNTTGFLLRRIAVPILFSFFLVAFTVLSFWVLYRSLIRQRRLAEIKNEFISNITHELKTPIATVSVAIEALRSFSASMDPQRTREYLDISANELQRLSLLVDKVLKLSMFEKKEIELRNEVLDMDQLVAEVTSSMRLQFEKRRAKVDVQTGGDATLEGDRLHLVSVLFNLIDNALKYTVGEPEIRISVRGEGDMLRLAIADNGIGIPPEYHGRIFEKFFRVPTGNLHNAKGYGLGLSYVAHVVQKHGGTIQVDSGTGKGSRFIILLPRGSASRRSEPAGTRSEAVLPE
jgi:two-component system phosphate regulon sensor histidine kinase PhoR